MSSPLTINSFCVVVGSHISNPKRIPYLIECLISLVRQTIPIAIHVSMSFAEPEIKTQTIDAIMSNAELVAANRIQIRLREEKTPQMRHIEHLVNELQGIHEWIMFCDDDDTYEPTRASKFASSIAKGVQEVEEMNVAITNPSDKKILFGLYESSFGKNHREHRHEYWCYCSHINTLKTFYEKLAPYPDILDDKCCDVLYAEHLRRAGENKLFIRIQEKLYNYRVENNSDSITGVIQTNQPKYTILKPAPPREQVQEWADYIVYWNGYLYENMQVYIHDTYLRALVGCEFDYILRNEFLANYPLMEFVDACHVEGLRAYYDRLRDICNIIYDIKI